MGFRTLDTHEGRDGTDDAARVVAFHGAPAACPWPGELSTPLIC
jgi:hypothetical protein